MHRRTGQTSVSSIRSTRRVDVTGSAKCVPASGVSGRQEIEGEKKKVSLRGRPEGGRLIVWRHSPFIGAPFLEKGRWERRLARAKKLKGKRRNAAPPVVDWGCPRSSRIPTASGQLALADRSARPKKRKKQAAPHTKTRNGNSGLASCSGLSCGQAQACDLGRGLPMRH